MRPESLEKLNELARGDPILHRLMQGRGMIGPQMSEQLWAENSLVVMAIAHTEAMKTLAMLQKTAASIGDKKSIITDLGDG